jgi:hypothetical protein
MLTTYRFWCPGLIAFILERCFKKLIATSLSVVFYVVCLHSYSCQFSVIKFELIYNCKYQQISGLGS